MDLFKTKVGEQSTGTLILIIALVGLAAVMVGTMLYNMLWTENVVVTTNNGSFIKRSMGPLSTKDRQAAIDAYNKAVTEKDGAAAAK